MANATRQRRTPFVPPTIRLVASIARSKYQLSHLRTAVARDDLAAARAALRIVADHVQAIARVLDELDHQTESTET